MSQTAFSLSAEPSLTTGAVQSCVDDAVVVAGPAGMMRAQRAAGCLLEPAPGDKVLVALCGQQAWVLSVLSRAPAADGAAVVRLPEKTRVESGAGLELVSPALALRGETVRVEGGLVALSGRCLTLTGALLRQKAGVAVHLAGKVFRVARELTERAGQGTLHFGRRTTRVEELDEANVGRMRLGVEESLRVRSQRADVRAEGQLRLDGEHINIG